MVEVFLYISANKIQVHNTIRNSNILGTIYNVVALQLSCVINKWMEVFSFLQFGKLNLVTVCPNPLSLSSYEPSLYNFVFVNFNYGNASGKIYCSYLDFVSGEGGPTQIQFVQGTFFCSDLGIFRMASPRQTSFSVFTDTVQQVVVKSVGIQK